MTLLSHNVQNHIIVIFALLEKLLQGDLWEAKELGEGLTVKLLVGVAHVAHLEAWLLEVF